MFSVLHRGVMLSKLWLGGEDVAPTVSLHCFLLCSSEVTSPSENTDEEEELDLFYDPVLNCYFDPKTQKYYELRLDTTWEDQSSACLQTGQNTRSIPNGGLIHTGRDASKWDLLSSMGVFTLHTSNIKRKTSQFAWSRVARPVWIRPDADIQTGEHLPISKAQFTQEAEHLATRPPK